MSIRAACRRPAVVVVVLVGGLLPLACGSGRSGLTAVEQNQLLGLIAQARTAAAAGDSAGAQSALTQVRASVSQLRTAGVLDPARAARMQSVAAQAQSAARAQATAAPAVSAPAAKPAVPAPKPRPAAPATGPTTAPPPAADPAQTIIQGARHRVSQALGKQYAKLRDKINQLQNRFAGRGNGGGAGGGD